MYHVLRKSDERRIFRPVETTFDFWRHISSHHLSQYFHTITPTMPHLTNVQQFPPFETARRQLQLIGRVDDAVWRHRLRQEQSQCYLRSSKLDLGSTTMIDIERIARWPKNSRSRDDNHYFVFVDYVREIIQKLLQSVSEAQRRISREREYPVDADDDDMPLLEESQWQGL